MTKRKILKTTKQEIANYWKDRIDAKGVSVAFAQASTHCWRCGVRKRLDRCHIIPHAKGGEDIPSNYILLCKHCHVDNPNLDDSSIIWDWLAAYALHTERPFWYEQGLREFAFIYGQSLASLLEDHKIDPEIFDQSFKEMMKETGFHFGQPRHNAATVAGVMKRVIDIYKKEA